MLRLDNEGPTADTQLTVKIIDTDPLSRPSPQQIAVDGHCEVYLSRDARGISWAAENHGPWSARTCHRSCEDECQYDGKEDKILGPPSHSDSGFSNIPIRLIRLSGSRNG
jgi:hypothetical protein